MSARMALGASALLLLAACPVGTTGKGYAPAKGPAGATVTLEVAGGTKVVAELLAVEDSTLLVLRAGRLARVALSLVTSGKAPKVSFAGPTLAGETRQRLRLISRYPQGVSPDLEARLLQAYGQSGVEEVSDAAVGRDWPG